MSNVPDQPPSAFFRILISFSHDVIKSRPILPELARNRFNIFPKSILNDRSQLYNKGASRASVLQPSVFGPKLSYYSLIRNRFRVFTKSILNDRSQLYNKGASRASVFFSNLRFLFLILFLTFFHCFGILIKK